MNEHLAEGNHVGRPRDVVARFFADVDLVPPGVVKVTEWTGQVVRAGRTLVVCRGEAFADGAERPFAAMQATMTALYDRPGVSG